jgi:polyisoprenoid-binding protein YceI
MLRSMTLALALAVSAPAMASDWKIDDGHTTVNFSVKHMVVTNQRGNFDKFEGTVMLDDKDVKKSSVDIKIDAASINTKNAKRDEHLRSPEFFDTAKFPAITFKSTKVENGKKGGFKVTGDLTMHGVTKPVVLAVDKPSSEVTDPWGNVHVGSRATTTIKRQDFGLSWATTTKTGEAMVGDDVNIEIELELIKVVAPAAAAPAPAPAAPAAPAPAPVKK